MSNSTTTTQLIPQRSINRYSILDNEPIEVYAIHCPGIEAFKELRLQRSVAEQIASFAEVTRTPISALGSIEGLQLAERSEDWESSGRILAWPSPTSNRPSEES